MKAESFMSKVKEAYPKPEENVATIATKPAKVKQAELVDVAKMNSRKAESKAISARLKKSGLDPQRMLDFAKVHHSWRYSKNLRHFLIIASFIVFVALPSALISFYMIFIASDQYHSSASFAVRSSNSSSPMDLLGVVMQTGAEGTVSNSYILHDYLKSQSFFEEISREFDFQNIYANPEWDWYFRMGTDFSVERQLDYWRTRIDTKFDQVSGIIVVEVIAFLPQDAQKLMKFIVEKSEMLINGLSKKAESEAVSAAQKSVAAAEVRLRTVRHDILEYREISQELSPEDDAKLAYQVIGDLEAAVTEKEATFRALHAHLDENSTRMNMLNNEIGALKAQLEVERQRLGGGSQQSSVGATNGAGNRTLSYRVGNYSDLVLEQEFAEQYYTTALAGLEKARAEAASKKLYLATFVSPTLSQEAQFPSRKMISLSALLLLLGIWSVGILTYYNLSDRN
ncbi:RkpR, polysaccharide export protein [uncultured Roseibium sp.]|uniref:RkpR, polysaccharide export protein n=1 Tax=uncultured Roseibium sp. TaxID=1936171 RepID=UPI00259841AA|nr:RkpR, polysaccharide export protein [uncultured Roseibium sp.]